MAAAVYFSCEPEQRLTDREVADYLGDVWIGVQALPYGDVLGFVVGDAREDQRGVANGEIVPVLYVVSIRPLRFICDVRNHEIHHRFEPAAVRRFESPQI